MKTLTKIKKYFSKQKYVCPYCGREWDDFFGPQICHDLDLKQAAHDKKKLETIFNN